MVSITSLNIALSLMPRSSGGFDFSALAGGASSGGMTFNAGSVHVALSNAEKNEDKQRDQIAKDPIVRKELERYAAVVKNATTIEEVLDDPVARRVFLKANGLGDQENAVALAKKALSSDLSDDGALVYRLSSINGNWLSTAKKYDFHTFGVELLKLNISIAEVTSNYVGEKRLDMLDDQLPGLGSAILFKQIAKDLDSPIKILGSALGREVVTTALGLPKQIALQSLEAQESAIAQRLDAKKLKDPEFVDKLVQRYLIQLNGGASGLTV
ncbi:MAG TPA: DUF1217 domain-containing protein [Hyphomonadaceae bacterium]|nr:DUF1217 domain-containing protein [Hyphomonadaceae bacterium]